MIILWAGLIVVVVTALAITAMLLVRRQAPAGSYFEDGDRAAGVFGVLATGFAVLLGFVVFLAFQSFDTSRSGAETEAEIVTQQFETAQFFPPAARAPLSGELLCYARTVIHQEWPQMQAGTLGDAVNLWGVATFRALKAVEPQVSLSRRRSRSGSTSRTVRPRAPSEITAPGVIPVPLWIVLLLSAVVIFVYMLFFADSAERAVVQATMMGGVAIVISSMLLLLWFLDNPYHAGIGGLQPVAMERAIRILDQGKAIIGGKLTIPCDDEGPRVAANNHPLCHARNGLARPHLPRGLWVRRGSTQSKGKPYRVVRLPAVPITRKPLTGSMRYPRGAPCSADSCRSGDPGPKRLSRGESGRAILGCLPITWSGAV